ncbi:hypothetical protein VDGL01_06983 [Verticillium dahliae]
MTVSSLRPAKAPSTSQGQGHPPESDRGISSPEIESGAWQASTPAHSMPPWLAWHLGPSPYGAPLARRPQLNPGLGRVIPEILPCCLPVSPRLGGQRQSAGRRAAITAEPPHRRRNSLRWAPGVPSPPGPDQKDMTQEVVVMMIWVFVALR